MAVRAVPCLSGNRNGLDSLQRGSGAHDRNGRDPAVDQEVCPDNVRRIVRREVNCQLRDFQRIGHPLAWIVGAEDVLNRLALLFAWEATEHRRVRRAWAEGIHANPPAYEFGAEDSSEMDDRGLAGRDGRGCRPPLARANGRIDDYRRALPEQQQGFLNREVSPFEIDGYHLVEALLCHLFEQQELAVTDHFPRRDTSLVKLGSLKPVFDRTSGKGTLTAGKSSPLTDGAAAIWVATANGISRLPHDTPRVRLIDFEIAAVDILTEGLLMAPVFAIPRILARRGLKFDDIALWEIHEAFSAQVLCHIKALEDKDFVQEKAGVEHNFGVFPRDRMNPNGGSVALGHPFAATGARILSQAIKELAAMSKESRAIVSICADGGLGTVALLEN